MKNTEIKINIEAREAGYKAAEAAAHAKFNAAQKAYDEACRRFATATAENRADAEKAMNEAHDYCYGEAQAEYDAACKAAFEKFFSLNPTAEEIAAAEAENNIEEIAEINAADVKINVADNGKIIEQIKVDVDTAINIINRLNYRNDTFVYSNTTRYDNADIKCRHFDAYKADGEKDAFAITEYVINGKLEIVRFFNLFRDITVDLQIGNVNYTIGDKGAIVLTDGDNPDNEPDDKQAKKEMARKLTDYLNGHYEQRLQAGYKPITPYATCDVRYQKLHPVARWTVGYDSVNDTFGIWSEYGWHESGFSLGHEFCGWYKIAKLAVIIARLKDAIDYAQTEFYFEDTDTLSKRPRRGYGKRTRLCYGKWRQIQAANLKDKIDRDAQGADEDNVFSLLPALDELNDVDIVDDDDNTLPAEEFAADKPKLTRNQIQKMINCVIAEREEYYDDLEEYEADDECPQMHIDYLHDMIEKLGKQYWELVKLYDNAPAEEIAG